jgi:hypothetical protein
MAKSKKFEPDYYFVRTVAETPLRRGEPNDLIVTYRSDLILRQERPEEPEAKPIASLYWRVINFTEAENQGENLFDVMDAESSDMAHLYEWIVDPKSGFFREETGAELWGDVLYVDTLEVQRGFDLRVVTHELVEHILSVLGHGCALATYLRGSEDPIPFVRALEERGFVKLKGSGNGYCLSLALDRPPLPSARTGKRPRK